VLKQKGRRSLQLNNFGKRLRLRGLQSKHKRLSDVGNGP
jgi:hypothetical protein